MKTATQLKKKYTLKSIRAVIKAHMQFVGRYTYSISSQAARNEGFTAEEWNAMHEAYQTCGYITRKEDLVEVLHAALMRGF